MGLLDRLWWSPEDQESEKEESEEQEDGPRPNQMVDFRIHIEQTRPEYRVKITYADGSTEKVTFDDYEESNGVRTYKRITDWEGTRTYKSHNTPERHMYGLNYQYEQVKEIVVENVRSFEILRELEETYTGTYEESLKYRYFKEHYKNYDVEVISGNWTDEIPDIPEVE